MDSDLKKFVVKGDEGADVDVLGVTRKVGEVVDLTAEQAQPLVEAGTLEAAPEETQA